MVSMQQTSLSLEERKARAMTNLEALLSSKKRKWEEKEEEGEEDGREMTKSFKFNETITSPSDLIELQLDRPLPVEWQRCLDIKSGQMHFYNTRTHKRTSKDPSQQNQNQNPELSLDLELKLTCKPEIPTGRVAADDRCNSRAYKDDNLSSDLYRPSPLPPPVESNRQEMMAGVCMRCHMLVMMCKAAPSCPNCKFVHPPSMQCSSSLLQPGSGLFLCCKDSKY